jgi:hypothetical protein
MFGLDVVGDFFSASELTGFERGDGDVMRLLMSELAVSWPFRAGLVGAVLGRCGCVGEVDLADLLL